MPRAKKTLLVCLDGIRPDALLIAHTPFIHNLVHSCTYSFHAQCPGTPLSYPAWTSTFTGVTEAVHGITSNTPPPTPFTPPAWDRDLTTAVVLQGWYGLRNVIYGGNENTFGRGEVSVGEGNQLHMFAEKDIKAAVSKMTSLLAAPQVSDISVLYLHGADQAGHDHGFAPHIQTYVDKIAELDQYVQQVWCAARARRDREDWLLVLTTDHGGRVRQGLSKGVHGTRGLSPESTIFVMLEHDGIPQEIIPPPTNTYIAQRIRAHFSKV